jgi:hypothetical protein
LRVVRTILLPSLLVVAVTFALVSDAEARKRRWVEFYIYAPNQAVIGREFQPSAPRGVGPSRPGEGRGLGTVIARLLRDCHNEASQLKEAPLDVIDQVAGLDDGQRGELDNLRRTAHSVGERLATECPQVPQGATARLDVVEQAVHTADAGFAALEPVLKRFYALLDDEQKARILRDVTLAQRSAGNAPRPDNERRNRTRRSSPKPAATTPPAAAPWVGLCQDFTTALRNWPMREIEQGVRLSETQRVVLYELVTASLKAAETLADRCPQEKPITPVRRMAVLRLSLQAIRDAAASIKPAFAHFYEALDQTQRAKFVEMR